MKKFSVVLMIILLMSVLCGCDRPSNDETMEDSTQETSVVNDNNVYTGELKFIIGFQPYGYKVITDSIEITSLMRKIEQLKTNEQTLSQPTDPGTIFSFRGNVNGSIVEVVHVQSNGEHYIEVDEKYYPVTEEDLDEIIELYNQSSAKAEEW